MFLVVQRQAGAELSNVVWMQERLNQKADCLLDRIRQYTERCNQWAKVQQKPLIERYIEGWLDFCWFFPRTFVLDDRLEAVGDRDAPVILDYDEGFILRAVKDQNS